MRAIYRFDLVLVFVRSRIIRFEPALASLYTRSTFAFALIMGSGKIYDFFFTDEFLLLFISFP